MNEYASIEGLSRKAWEAGKHSPGPGLNKHHDYARYLGYPPRVLIKVRI